MKNGEIVELYEALNRICSQKDLKLKVSIGYTFLKNKEKLYPEANYLRYAIENSNGIWN